MRLTSEFWATALIRRIRLAGGFAYLAERGADDAGAIFIKQGIKSDNFHEDLWALYGPAPQSVYNERKPNERGFILLIDKADRETIDKRLVKEKKFDSDIWVLEIENIEDLSPYILISPDICQ